MKCKKIKIKTKNIYIQEKKKKKKKNEKEIIITKKKTEKNPRNTPGSGKARRQVGAERKWAGLRE